MKRDSPAPRHLSWRITSISAALSSHGTQKLGSEWRPVLQRVDSVFEPFAQEHGGPASLVKQETAKAAGERRSGWA